MKDLEFYILENELWCLFPDGRNEQSDLRNILGCTQPTISQIENGRMPMPTNFIRILNEKFGKDIIEKYIEPNTTMALSDNGSTSIAGNGNHHINANATLEMAIKEISEQRKLVAKAQEQIDRLITLLEKK